MFWNYSIVSFPSKELRQCQVLPSHLDPSFHERRYVTESLGSRNVNPETKKDPKFQRRPRRRRPVSVLFFSPVNTSPQYRFGQPPEEVKVGVRRLVMSQYVGLGLRFRSDTRTPLFPYHNRLCKRVSVVL